MPNTATENAILFVIFMLFISLVTTGIITWFGGLKIQQEKAELIEECEKPLPRTEHCKLIAIPMKKEGEE